MSKIRNRSVKTLPYDLSNLLTVSHKNKYRTNYQEVDYFGENIQDVNTTPPHMPFPSKDIPPQSFSALSSGDVDSITLELNKLSGLSSSSSLSWSDEYESETTKKVQDELERMDRVLRGEEPIPPHYDKDEYEQWMNIFPDLRITKG
ncbi:hypothetical protein NQ318_017410 [Aromia moschata]|uniref:Uncharacterized protein n=1 Tax=Aromia moschata TaxID=1265417 RepID=A0AAV8Z2B2_9CUCU|nr:hypothetical protein NQ318_017410 [Aromia moschata]